MRRSRSGLSGIGKRFWTFSPYDGKKHHQASACLLWLRSRPWHRRLLCSRACRPPRNSFRSSRPSASRSSNSNSNNSTRSAAKAPADYSRAPSAKKPEAPPTSTVVVMGDSMADWLAYGLEEAFADTPEIGIVRKHKALFRSHPLRVAQRSRMVERRARHHEYRKAGRRGDDARLERPRPDPRASGREACGTAQAQPETPAAQPEQQTPDAEAPQAEIMAPEAPKGRGSSNEFRSEIWAELYSKKIADTIAAMKSRGVPVIWVGLPIIRGPKATSDAQYLNDLYRAQAEKAGIIYVDVWDGFVDEAGKFAVVRSGRRRPDAPAALARRRLFHQIRRAQARALRGTGNQPRDLDARIAGGTADGRRNAAVRPAASRRPGCAADCRRRLAADRGCGSDGWR